MLTLVLLPVLYALLKGRKRQKQATTPTITAKL